MSSDDLGPVKVSCFGITKKGEPHLISDGWVSDCGAKHRGVVLLDGTL